jgi:hypothetical protein
MTDTTLIVPIGPFTPELSRRVREAASQTAHERGVVISMQATKQHSWSALCELAEWVRTNALPCTQALLRELGVESASFSKSVPAEATARIWVI